MIRKLQAFPSVRGVAFAVGVFVATVLVLAGEKAAFAQAVAGQNFGNHGQFAITAENLFGLTIERVGVEGPNDSETATTSTNIGLLHRTTEFRGPWVGAHYFVIPNLSIGGNIGFVSTGSSVTRTENGRTTTTDGVPTFTLVAMPKVGYALMFTNMLGFWFRGGPGLYTSSQGDRNPSPNIEQTRNTTFWFLSLDALFVIAPTPNFGFFVGPQANLSFAGSTSDTTNGTTTSSDANFRSFSIDAGLYGAFDLL
jgi:hypothetical protein